MMIQIIIMMIQIIIVVRVPQKLVCGPWLIKYQVRSIAQVRIVIDELTFLFQRRPIHVHSHLQDGHIFA